MKPVYMLALVCGMFACNNSEPESNHPEETAEPLILDTVALDAFERKVRLIDASITARDMDSSAVRYILLGESTHYMELFSYRNGSDLVMLESYIFHGKKKIFERFHFSDGHLVRFDEWTHQPASLDKGRAIREERHYSHENESIFRSYYREGNMQEQIKSGLEAKQFLPLVQFDVELKQTMIGRKAQRYLSKIQLAETLPLDAVDSNWPLRERDMEKVRDHSANKE